MATDGVAKTNMAVIEELLRSIKDKFGKDNKELDESLGILADLIVEERVNRKKAQEKVINIISNFSDLN